jgi:hypothetical protein
VQRDMGAIVLRRGAGHGGRVDCDHGGLTSRRVHSDRRNCRTDSRSPDRPGSTCSVDHKWGKADCVGSLALRRARRFGPSGRRIQSRKHQSDDEICGMSFFQLRLGIIFSGCLGGGRERTGRRLERDPPGPRR